MNDDLLQSGIRRARCELELAPAAQLSPAQMSVAYKYALVEWLAERWGGVTSIRHRLRTGELTREQLRKSASEYFDKLSSTWEGIPSLATLHTRIVELAVDAVQSERLCPELQLVPEPVRLPEMPVHTLVFSAFPHITNELYPLLVDAYVAGSLAVGVHESWLTPGSFRRAILFDEETQGVVEVDVLGQPCITSALVLALNLRDEHQSHQRIESALPGVRLLNPCVGAQLLDDKAKTAAIWQQVGLPTPRYQEIAADTPMEEALEELEHFAATTNGAVVLKPAGGTEGQGVEYLQFNALPREQISQLLTCGLCSGSMILAEEHGSLRYAGAAGNVRFAVRLNVCWDGTQAWAESGYAQVACAPGAVASAGRGGALITLGELWAHLCYADGASFTPTTADWQCLLDLAQQGVAALAAQLTPSMPRLVGVDVLLDADARSHFLPVLLEANPRPAGLGHARFLTPGGPADEPGVSLRLWWPN